MKYTAILMAIVLPVALYMGIAVGEGEWALARWSFESITFFFISSNVVVFFAGREYQSYNR